MAIEVQSVTEIYQNATLHDEYEVLRSILADHGYPMSDTEVMSVANELLGFFEALGEENDPEDQDDA